MSLRPPSSTFLFVALVLAPAVTVAQPPDTLKTLCGGRSNCKLVWAKPAGEDDQKRPMTVIDLGLAGDVDYDAPQISEDCNPHEIWVVAGSKKVETRKLIATLCNDGYGSRGMGEDRIEVKPNRLLLSKTGGSSWMWTTHWEIGLSPTPRIISEGTSGWWTLGDHNDSWTWSRDEFAGQSRWSAPTCGDAPVMRGGSFAAIPVPVVRGGEWDWQKTSLGQCSVHLTAADDPAKRGGGVVHGKRSTPPDGSLRVLGLSNQAFVIEIEDDYFHTSAKSWVKRDHIEVWVGDKQDYMDHCLDDGRTQQWGIMLDGEVVPAHGKPKKRPKASVVRDGGVVRMKVVLPEPAAMLTFVYSDTDDGESQERLIATSALEFGKNHTLGRTYSVPKDDADCRVEGTKLVVRQHPARPLVKW